MFFDADVASTMIMKNMKPKTIISILRARAALFLFLSSKIHHLLFDNIP